MSYVDGFLLVVPNKKLPAYIALAKKAARVWKKHGALEYFECAGDDLPTPCGPRFDERAGAKKGETVVFSWIVYRSRAHRDRVNKKVMADPAFAALCGAPMPFDMEKMSHGGFRVLVQA